jgi:hypothetical protein
VGSPRLEQVRRIYDRWSRGEFSADDWAAPDIQLVAWEGFGPVRPGRAGMAETWRDWLSSWEDFRVEAEEYLERGESVLALTRFGGRGKASGVSAEMMRGGSRFDFRGDEVARLTLFRERAPALADWYGGSLAGVWDLVEWTYGDSRPLGDDAVGRLIYSDDGFMTAFLARADGWSDALAYSGSWELRGREEVIHHVSLSTRESFVGKDLVRAVSWEGADLVLTTPPRDGVENVLRWRRAGG